jgi:FAD/FMN-containing dehydrogenase
MYGITSSAPEVRALKDELTGAVTVAGDAGWDDARAAWNLALDQRPAVVAEPETVADVVAIMSFARERGLRVTAQGTGHGASALGSLHDTVLVKTSRMRVVGVDPEGRLARAQAGAIWADIVAPASEHGLAPLAGSAHDVGVVGYTLGGGVGWLGRKHGLAANGVVAIQVVTADGRVRVVDADHEPDLFWALRGGGGSFGIVTAIEIELHPVDELCAGMLAFPWERAGEVLRAWREWTRTVPDEVTSLGRIMQIPPLPEIPEPLRGRSLAVIEVACLHGEASTAELVAPLRELGPEIDTIAPMGPAGLLAVHMDPPEPVPGAGDGALLDELPGEAIDALVAAAGPGSGSPLVSVEVRHLGGALGRAHDNHGALAAIEADFGLYAVGMAPDADAATAVNAHIDVVKGAVSEWHAERRLLNFSERRGGDDMFAPEALRRLRAVKTLVDPDDMIRANHPIAPID